MEKKNKLSQNVVILGLVSFFNDFASEMVYPVVPIFLTTVLGAPIALVGLIEGIAESTASLLKVFSGWLSDRAQKRKIFAVYGYSFSTLAKLIIGIASGWPLVLLGRFIDRLGKGIRTSPRDALIADSTDEASMGKAFGFHRALDTAGAVFGPLAAILLIDHYGSTNLRPIFYIAFVPGVIGVILLLTLIKEKPFIANLKPPQFKLANLTPAYKIFLLVSAIFALGNSSDAFLILRAQYLGLSTTHTIFAYVVFNLVYSLLATSLGSWSDRIGPRRLLAAGFFLFALIYLFFGINQSTTWIWWLFALYGVYMSLTEGISKAYITRIASREVIATSFGAYQTIIGICTFFASLIAGLLWSRVNPGAPFIFGAILALIAGTIFVLLGRSQESGEPSSTPSRP
ncbi:MAG: MFS transporter [Firmicutes bacterium]|nr:MFS transporter [Bacillota bacterium]